MKLQYVDHYKSIKPFNEIDLNTNLAIITGINGSGKSQLLEAINNGAVKIESVIKKNIVHFDYSSFNLKNAKEGDSLDLDLSLNELWDKAKQRLSIIPLKQFLTVEFLWSLKNLSHQLNTPFWDLTQDQIQEPDIFNKLQEYKEIIKKEFNTDSDFDQSILKFIQSLKYHIENVTESFFKTEIQRFLDTGLLNSPALFTIKRLTSICIQYADEYQKNSINMHRNQHEGENVSYIEPKEYTNIKKPPWVLINEILQEYGGIEYEVNKPELTIKPNQNRNWSIKLLSKTDQNLEINFNDLSSGEKILMALVVSIYRASFEYGFPKVLLLDEIDAFLHPAMIQNLLTVIQKTFIEKNKVKIIMTTHSPTTVALAPKNSRIYRMHRYDQNSKDRLQEISKDEALKVLTVGVPTLSIDYQNRRQVFVESDNDVRFYEACYQRLLPKLNSNISLSFISSGASRTDQNGNCEQVKKIVRLLRETGAKSIFGIIDWDKKNTHEEGIKVSGANERYTIENFIFDPLLVAAYLLRAQKNQKQTDDILNLTQDKNYVDFKTLDNDTLQKVSDYIVDQVKPHLLQADDSIEVEYCNAKKIKISKSYLYEHGHELEKKIKKTFNLHHQTGNYYQQQIVDNVIDDIPELIPKKILLLFKSLQEDIK